MCPLNITKRGSEFGEQMFSEKGSIFFSTPTEKFFNKVEHYYHSFQFYQFITYYHFYKNTSFENSFYYYFYRKKMVEINENNEKTKLKLIQKIEKERVKWMKHTNEKIYKDINITIDRHTDWNRKEKRFFHQRFRCFQGKEL